MTIIQKLENFKALIRDLRIIAMDSLVDTRDEYLDMQRDQMTRGINSDGGEIGTYRSKAYQFMKERMNPLAGGTVDLKLTGDFQAELTLRRMSNKEYSIYSQDVKAPMLKKKYGENIYFPNFYHTSQTSNKQPILSTVQGWHMRANAQKRYMSPPTGQPINSKVERCERVHTM